MRRRGSPPIEFHDGDLTVADVMELATPGDRDFVSVYLPTHVGRHEAAQDPVRLRRLVAHAEAELGDARLVRPVRELSEKIGLWAQGAGGLCVLVDRTAIRCFRTVKSSGELAVVSDRFHLKPLLWEAGTSQRFDVLALSQHSVRLLRWSRAGSIVVDVPDLPTGLPDALRWDDREPQIRSHAAGRVGRGQVTAAFHGPSAADARDADVRRFLRAVDRAIVRARSSSVAPLVLAGVDELVAEYRAITRCTHVVDPHLSGNPDHLTPTELTTDASRLVERASSELEERVRGSIRAAGAGAVDTVRQAVMAAEQGRIETVFVPADATRWGRAGSDGTPPEEHDERRPADHDLLDVVAVETLRHGGDAFIVPTADLPGDGALVFATIRF